MLRARESGESFEEFVRIARDLSDRKVIGRFSTFLEHVKPSADGTRVTRYNALFHWRVPEGARSKPAARSGVIIFSPTRTGAKVVLSSRM